jgi:hypothetical protein
MLPSQYPDVQGYPNLQRLLQAQVDMQFADLRLLLRLPIPRSGLEAGCNFACAAVLFNIIAGASVCFYEASENALADRGARGKRFKEVLEKFYPWQGEPLNKDQCVSVLYESARNPLAHSLGLDTPPNDSIGKQVALMKEPLTQDQICELEEASIRPNWLSSTIVHHQPLVYGAMELAISVPTLYWGVHRMFHAIFAESNQAAKADALAKTFAPQWDKSVSDTGFCTDTVTVQRE